MQSGSSFYIDVRFAFPQVRLRQAYVGLTLTSSFLHLNGTVVGIKENANLSTSVSSSLIAAAEASFVIGNRNANASIGDIANRDLNASTDESLVLRFFGQATGRFNRDRALDFVVYVGGRNVAPQETSGAFTSALGQLFDGSFFFGATFGNFVTVGSTVGISLPLNHIAASDADVFNFTVRDYQLQS